MIKCNLAVLLAERGLKMSDIIHETSLSKTAIRGLYYNTSKGIQFETLEIICDYLNVSPNEVIKKVTFAYKILEKEINNKISTITYKIAFFIDRKNYIFSFTVAITNFDYLEDDLSKTSASYELAIDFKFDNEFNRTILQQITDLEKDRLDMFLINDFFKTLHLENHKLICLTYNNSQIRQTKK